MQGDITLAEAEHEMKGQDHINYFWNFYFKYAMPLPEFVNVRIDTRAHEKLVGMLNGQDDTIAKVANRLLGIYNREYELHPQ